ncbi:hypothetical protein TNCV_1875661 [Trichonephila clavipes]|nr:hypothetical protein TNCV_1875661 [Trichonephila clavipes]
MRVEEQINTIQAEEHRHLLQMMVPACNRRDALLSDSRQESITGESPTSFPEEDTTMPYSGLEPTRLLAECHVYHTGWATLFIIN